MQIHLDRQSRTPLHLQIAHQIREMILRGSIPEGRKLPPTRRLAETLGVNRSTVVSAYEHLWSEDLVESCVGRGTTVRARSAQETAPLSPPPWSMLFAPRSEALDVELRELARIFEREGLISLAAGLPAPDLYPVERIRDLTCELLTENGRALLEWCALQGYLPLRRILADQAGVPPGEILVLSGSTQGLFLLARVFLEPGDFVVTEAPTYLGALQAFRSMGARVVGIPLDADGMDVGMLENALSRVRPKFLYTLPTFQNPTGATMSLERRRHVLDLAYRFRIPVVEDDPYRPLRYEGDPLPTLKDLDTQGTVIRLETFTKTLFPGLRVGWMSAPPAVIDQLVPQKHLLDIFTNSLAQAVAARVLETGLLAEHVARVREAYRERRDTMARALRRYVPELEFTVPQGGYYIWCRLPGGVSARDLLREALAEGVSFLTGEVFFPDGRGQEFVRLTFTSQRPERIREAVKKIGRALRRVPRRRTPEAGAYVAQQPIV